MEKQKSSLALTDPEYSLLDELYFITGFKELVTKLGWEEEELKSLLVHLVEKDWVAYFANPDGERNPNVSDWKKSISGFYFLATKKGLMVHNTQ